MRRKKLLFVQHVSKNGAQTIGAHQAHKLSPFLSRRAHGGDITGEIGTIVDEPIQPALEIRKGFQHVGLDRQHCEQRYQSHGGTHAQRKVIASARMQHIVIKAILLVPQSNVLGTNPVRRVGDVDEVLPEFTGHVLVSCVLAGQLERNRQQIQAIHRHPTRAVRLLEMTAAGQRLTAIE